jgi:hypothetical protein
VSAQQNRVDSIAKQQEDKSVSSAREQDRVEKFIEKVTDGGWFFSANLEACTRILTASTQAADLRWVRLPRILRGCDTLRRAACTPLRTIRGSNFGHFAESCRGTSMRYNGRLDGRNPDPYYGWGSLHKEAESNFRLQKPTQGELLEAGF